MWCCSTSAKFLIDSILGGGDPLDGEDGANRRKAKAGSSSSQGVSLDQTYLGSEVVVVKNGLRVCGKGGALGSVPLTQTKSYFEVKVQQDGVWGVGLAGHGCPLEEGNLGGTGDSWGLRNGGELWHGGMSIGTMDLKVEEGDIIGVTFDHIELCFYINGKKGSISFANVRGTVFPALFVDEGAVLDIIFDKFIHLPPSGFDKIIKEKSLL